MSEPLASPKVDFDAPVGDGSAKRPARRVWLKRALIALGIAVLGGLAVYAIVETIRWFRAV